MILSIVVLVLLSGASLLLSSCNESSATQPDPEPQAVLPTGCFAGEVAKADGSDNWFCSDDEVGEIADPELPANCSERAELRFTNWCHSATTSLGA
jgi:hypothetical protein